MASKWVTFRDSILQELKFDTVTEKMKDDFSRWLLENLLPQVKEIAEKFVSQIREQAASESGWCKIRDLIVLPFIIDGGLWLIEQALEKTVDTAQGV